ncbi:hypothetical protein M885DRAFT_514275 [Pelagophyceae sp. CCMP2097]|nr:hypothetical protein M885DRAFT_514275 [Pelagophyceae sp. CCMP2097]
MRAALLLLALAQRAAAWSAPGAALRRPHRHDRRRTCAPRQTPPGRDAGRLRAFQDGENDGPPDIKGAWEAGLANGKALLEDRFVSPKIDDQGLIIADFLVAGVVAPGLEAIVFTVLGLPSPLWAARFGRGKLVLPVLARGLSLGACWLGGALAAKLYAREAYDFPPPDGAEDRYAVTMRRTLQAGSFAVALLVVSTQLDTTLSFGWPPPQLGDSEATDAILLRILDDLLRDVATEAVVLLSWRVARTSLSYLD